MIFGLELYELITFWSINTLLIYIKYIALLF